MRRYPLFIEYFYLCLLLLFMGSANIPSAERADGMSERRCGDAAVGQARRDRDPLCRLVVACLGVWRVRVPENASASASIPFTFTLPFRNG